MLAFIFFLVSLIIQHSHSETIVVDGVSEWKNPTARIGDSVIFQHKYQYGLYIFQNQEAFKSCDFTQATLLTKPNSASYVWHPSRFGFFYFSFNNGTYKPCLEGQKMAVNVAMATPPQNQPSPSSELPQLPEPPISSGGIASSPVSNSWPFTPKEGVSPSSSPTTSEVLPAFSPMVADKGGSFPFINSNPAVPLPTGEVDSATIRPVPTSGGHHIKMVGFLTFQRALCCVFLLILL